MPSKSKRLRPRGHRNYDPPRSRVKTGAAVGLVVSLLGLSVGVVRIALAYATGTRFPPVTGRTALLVPVYVLAFMVPGALLGLLWPASKWWVVRAALAFLFGFPFFIGPQVWSYGAPTRWDKNTWIVYATASTLLGFIVWYAYTRIEAPAA